LVVTINRLRSQPRRDEEYKRKSTKRAPGIEARIHLGLFRDGSIDSPP
jgi:hypothetical protein